MIVESFLIGDNVFGFDGGEDSYLVECILFFLFLEFLHLDFFEGVDLPIVDSLDFIYSAESTLAEFA